ncbi:MAG: ABC transporter permease [Nitrospirota bacterium]|nr:ABC transporter permease [Nitrospirota bacterium]MDH5768067.1 ABC transporter permease [Nitrospirota bacterium]
MGAYLVKKLFLLIPLLFGITLLTFILTKSLPGDPVSGMVGERAQPEVIERIRNEIGADKDVFRQYFGYIKLLLQGELGRSYYTNRKVFDDLILKFPNTLKLALGAMSIAIPVGLFLGFLSAYKRESITDRMITSLSVTGLSIPVFWSGLLLMLFFSLTLKLFPPSGTGDMKFLILPSITLSLPALATLARVTRTTLLEIFDLPFVTVTRSKGIAEVKLITIHVFKNALIPIVTVIGLDFGSYLNGAVLTETIFGWDGIGRFTMEGIIKRDYPVIMGCIITSTLIFVLINTVVDIVYHYLDPRIRLHEKSR